MQTSSPILNAKFFVPLLPENFVQRNELLAKITKASSYPIILCSAPSGNGKSTHIAAWLQNTAIPSCWLSLDKKDNDMQRFMLYVVSALQNQLGAQKTNNMSYSMSGNLKYDPIPQLRLGVEYMYGELELLKGKNGAFHRIQLAAKYAFGYHNSMADEKR